MTRPVEPYCHDAEPERWSEIAEWEGRRADELQKKLDELNDKRDTLANLLELERNERDGRSERAEAAFGREMDRP